MSAHNTKGLFSYTTGLLRRNIGGLTYLSSDSSAVLYSDRRYGTYPFGPFDLSQADGIGVGISVVATIYSVPTINITLTQNSWGGTKFTFVGRCDSSTNLLYGSFNSDTMAIISFGAPLWTPF
jgi:hypothetical protein